MYFCFETPDLVELRQRGFVFDIDGYKITDQLELFRAYGQGLNAPSGYFGNNWNAFLDSICDLGWIDIMEIFIVHRDLPCLPREDTTIYLEILREAIATWADEKTIELSRLYPDFVPHRLSVYFPNATKSLISAYLEKPPQPPFGS